MILYGIINANIPFTNINKRNKFMDQLIIFKYFLEGFMLGLTVGISCVFFCFPVLIGLASRNINNIRPTLDISFFLTGRFIAYIIIAVLFSFIGLQLKDYIKYDFILKFIISIILIIWGIKGFKNSDNNKTCLIKKNNKTIPFFAGILAGLSPCMPFIAGITRLINIGNIYTGIIYFSGFFISTSLFMLSGLSLELLNYKNELKILASIISFLFGFIFFFNALFQGINLWI